MYKLENCGTYQFQIKAENKFGVSDGCESEKVVLKDPYGLPGPPQRPRILGHTSLSMLVAWDPPKDNGGSTIQGYWLEKRERGAVYWSRVNRAPVTKPAVKSLEYNVLHLIEGVEYQFRVMAQNAAGIGPPSEATECVFAVDPRSTLDSATLIFEKLCVGFCNKLYLYSTERPSQPAAPQVKDKTKSSVTLTWAPPDKDGGSPIKGYIVEVQDEGSLDWKRVNQPDKPILTTSYTVPDLKENKKCRFRIVALNAAGESEPSPRTADTVIQDILGKIVIS